MHWNLCENCTRIAANSDRSDKSYSGDRRGYSDSKPCFDVSDSSESSDNSDTSDSRNSSISSGSISI